MIRTALLQLSTNDRVRQALESRSLLRVGQARFLAGITTAEAIAGAQAVQASGRLVALDYLGPDCHTLPQARERRTQYLRLLGQLADTGLSQGGRVEVTLRLSALGQALPADGHRIALEHAWDVCQAAKEADTTVTLLAHDHASAQSMVDISRELRSDFDGVGVSVQSCWHRSEDDCRDLAEAGARVRLSKGIGHGLDSGEYCEAAEVDLAFVRCAKILLSGSARPVVATHDRRLIAIAVALAGRAGRSSDSFEFQLRHGVDPATASLLVEQGQTVRTYLPYGEQWYGYLARTLARHPASLRSLLSVR